MKWQGLIVAACLSLSGAASAAEPAQPGKLAPDKLLDEPSVKVVRIVLPPGGVLPEHTTPVHATVAAMAGAGDVTIAKARHALPTHGVVFLPKGIPHAVFNTGKTPLVLLVHHLKTTK